MTTFTEKAIRESFVKLLNEQPLNKITVRSITAECGISRNTFYYHFHDVYDLLEKLFNEEEMQLTSGIQSASGLRQSLFAATRFVLENKSAIDHIYNSLSRDTLTKYLFNAATICMRNFVESQAQGLDVSQDDLDSIVYLYACMLEGAIINLLREGITSDAERMIEDSITTMEGTVRLALENCARRNA